tara:strand:- start:815 stop:1126 length:312 start_codon:yes stop_codon:yes gene_type:complete
MGGRETRPNQYRKANVPRDWHNHPKLEGKPKLQTVASKLQQGDYVGTSHDCRKLEDALAVASYDAGYGNETLHRDYIRLGQALGLDVKAHHAQGLEDNPATGG